MKKKGSISVKRKTYTKEPKNLNKEDYFYDIVLSQEFKKDVWVESDSAFNKRLQKELLKL